MADNAVKRHPIRGFLYGIVFGLGLAMVAVGQSWAALGTLPPFILLVVGIIVGTLWATFGPAKRPKGPAAAEPDAGPAPDPDPEPPAETAEAPTEAIEDATEEPVDEMNEMS